MKRPFLAQRQQMITGGDMADDPIVGEASEGQRPRPKVVDRRVSSRGSTSEGGEAPETSSSAPEAPATPRDAEEAAIPPPASSSPSQGSVEPQFAGEGPPQEVWTPEAEAEARAIAEEIVRRPSADWVVNSAVSLANIAATKLEMGDPADAQLCIDALAGILKETGAKLGEVEQPLRQTLAQLQMAFAQRMAPPPGAGTT
jgi:hypothetical protein